jgi:hypothetical protein
MKNGKTLYCIGFERIFRAFLCSVLERTDMFSQLLNIVHIGEHHVHEIQPLFWT